jgi:hypothetical protein
MIAVLKLIYDLRPEDLRMHPTWTHAYGLSDEPRYEDADIDEATYTPWRGNLPYDCRQPLSRPDIVATVSPIGSDPVFSPRAQARGHASSTTNGRSQRRRKSKVSRDSGRGGTF